MIECSDLAADDSRTDFLLHSQFLSMPFVSPRASMIIQDLVRESRQEIGVELAEAGDWIPNVPWRRMSRQDVPDWFAGNLPNAGTALEKLRNEYHTEGNVSWEVSEAIAPALRRYFQSVGANEATLTVRRWIEEATTWMEEARIAQREAIDEALGAWPPLQVALPPLVGRVTGADGESVFDADALRDSGVSDRHKLRTRPERQSLWAFKPNQSPRLIRGKGKVDGSFFDLMMGRAVPERDITFRWNGGRELAGVLPCTINERPVFPLLHLSLVEHCERNARVYLLASNDGDGG